MKNIITAPYFKYLVAIVAFLVIMLFFDQNDIFTQKGRIEELSNSEANIVYLKDEIASMARELDEIKANPKKVEQYAREQYHYKRPNEDLFLIVNDTIVQKSSK